MVGHLAMDIDSPPRSSPKKTRNKSRQNAQPKSCISLSDEIESLDIETDSEYQSSSTGSKNITPKKPKSTKDSRKVKNSSTVIRGRSSRSATPSRRKRDEGVLEVTPVDHVEMSEHYPMQHYTMDEETYYRDAHRRVIFPIIVSGYVRLFLSVSLAIAILYSVCTLFLAISSDIDNRVAVYSKDVTEQISQCAKDYRDNRCNPDTRIPAIEKSCQHWESCMNRDPYLVGQRSALTAQTLAEGINGFFDRLSWKSIACLFTLAMTSIIAYMKVGNEDIARLTRTSGGKEYRNNMNTGTISSYFHHDRTPVSIARENLVGNYHSNGGGPYGNMHPVRRRGDRPDDF